MLALPAEQGTGVVTVVASALFGGGLSLVALTRAAQEATAGYQWVTVIVAVTGLVAALASLIAALATFFRARDDEAPRRRRRR